MARMMSTEEQPSVTSENVHCLSESDSETRENTRANTKTKQRKKMAADSKVKTRGKNTDSTHQTVASEQTPEGMAEFKLMFAELRELRREAKEGKEAEERRTAEWEQGRPGKDGREYLGHQVGAYRDPWLDTDGYDYESENGEEGYNENYEDDDESEGSLNMNDHLTYLKASQETRPTGTIATKSPFSSFRAPAPPLPAEPEAVPTTTTTVAAATVTAKPKARREFKLDTSLHEGALLTELKDLYKDKKKPVAERITLSESMVGVIQHFYEGPAEGGPKPLKAIKELSRQYTGIKDVLQARVLAMNDEIRFSDGRKDGESSLLIATKGVVGALTAMAPTLDILLQRGSADPELNAQAMNMLSAVRLLVCTHNQMRIDRRLSVQKVVHSKLGKELIKERRDVYGDGPSTSEFLLGENLGEKNRQLMKSVRASDSCMTTGYRGKRRYQPDNQSRSGPYNKFRGNSQGRYRSQRGGRHSSTWGSRPQSTEKHYGRTNDDYAQYGNVPGANRGSRGRGNPSRGFQK